MTRLAPEDNFPHSKTSAFLDNVLDIVSVSRKKSRRPKIQNPERKNSPENQAKIEHWKELIGRDPETKALLDEALASGTQIYTDDTIKPLGFYSPADNILVVRPDRTDGEVVATMIHELTHRHQHKLGYGLSPSMSPRDLILVLFSMEADAEANAVAESYKLAKAGFPDALEAHLKTGYGDISRKFLEKVKENPENAENGVAQRAAYDQWFEQSWRRKAYGEQAAGIILNNLQTFATVFVTQGFMDITSDLVAGIGQKPNGRNYLADTKEIGDDLTSERYRKGLPVEVEVALGAIDKAFHDLKEKINNPQPESDDKPEKVTPPELDDTENNLENLVRKFAGRMVLTTTMVNGLYLPIPSKTDRYRKPRKGPVPMPVF